MASSVIPKKLLLALVIFPSSFLILPVGEADAACLRDVPPIFVMTDSDYYSLYLMGDEKFADDTVVISGNVRSDIIDENKFENRVLLKFMIRMRS